MPPTRQFCSFFLSGELFGLPVEQVQEVIRYQEMTRVPLASEVIRGLINLRGQIVVALDLRRRLRMQDRTENELPLNIVVRSDDGIVCFLVDEIGDVIEVSEHDFEPPPETLEVQVREAVRGVYKLPGRLLLALDTDLAIGGGKTSR